MIFSLPFLSCDPIGDEKSGISFINLILSLLAEYDHNENIIDNQCIQKESKEIMESPKSKMLLWGFEPQSSA